VSINREEYPWWKSWAEDPRNINEAIFKVNWLRLESRMHIVLDWRKPSPLSLEFEP